MSPPGYVAAYLETRIHSGFPVSDSFISKSVTSWLGRLAPRGVATTGSSFEQPGNATASAARATSPQAVIRVRTCGGVRVGHDSSARWIERPHGHAIK